ncbi:hypothetical protein ACNKHW_24440 [Shigella flexneri]
MPLHVQTDRVIRDPACGRTMSRKKGRARARIENLEELVTATNQFSYQDADEGLTPYRHFCLTPR